MEQMSRAAGLHYAYQHGQDAAKGDVTAESEFKQKFAGDAEAEHEYQFGFASGAAKIVHVGPREGAPELFTKQALEANSTPEGIPLHRQFRNISRPEKRRKHGN